MEHKAFVGLDSSRVKNNGRTVGWYTKCSCGHIVRTEGSHLGRHKAQVAKHIAENETLTTLIVLRDEVVAQGFDASIVGQTICITFNRGGL